MPQYARPTSTVSRGIWTDQAGGTSGIHARIADTTSDPALLDINDYVTALSSTLGGAVDEMSSYGLSAITDPVTAQSASLRIVADASNTGNLLVELRASGVLVVSVTCPVSGARPLEVFDTTLTAGHLTTIRNNSGFGVVDGALQLRLTLDQNGTIWRPKVYQAYAQFLIPGFAHLDISPTGCGLKVVAANSGAYLIASPAGCGYKRVISYEEGAGALKLVNGYIKAHS